MELRLLKRLEAILLVANSSSSQVAGPGVLATLQEMFSWLRVLFSDSLGAFLVFLRILVTREVYFIFFKKKELVCFCKDCKCCCKHAGGSRSKVGLSGGIPGSSLPTCHP